MFHAIYMKRRMKLVENKTILEVKELKKYFPKQKDILGNVKLWLKAVDDVSFNLESGKTIGVVGEYIGKIYLETKHRPKYIVSEYVGKDE